MKALYYEDFKLLPDQEVSVRFLMEKVMSVLHLICVENEHALGSVNLGIGFPQYNREHRTLGGIIRVYAETAEMLSKASADERIQRLSDYLQPSEIQQVPDSVTGYGQYRRVQVKENKERLMRRYAKRHGVSMDEAEKEYAGFKKPDNDLPYVTLNSLSSGHRFRLYVEEVRQEKDEGALAFNSYGLTKTGSLPLF